MRRTAMIALVAAIVAAIGGYAAGARRETDPASHRDPGPEVPSDEGDDAPLGDEPAALQACEERLEAAESALAQRPPTDAPGVDVASLPDDARAVIARPEVTRAIELEVERRIEERFAREREQRRAEWAARRAEMRERMRAIGIDDATM